MPTRRWDPGIGDEIRIGAEGQQGKNQELSEGKFSSNLTRFDWVSGIGNFGIFWPVWVIKWSTICIGMVEMITTVDSQAAILTKEGMGLRYCSYGQYKEVTTEIYGGLYRTY
ncbi:hypothetical protein IGI04_014905 [Brassica rapa subsp. trilocularis]|uniref:Uncharacterized protein n=1 Tax=Brassica rapa subsp. trilocularis TaxID=1813537 RepID=A0ABQ7MNI9_BRACM|nr:hypothetical protein IGI04_014905 [Brassica rapa subsp. trilocularis]